MASKRGGNLDLFAWRRLNTVLPGPKEDTVLVRFNELMACQVRQFSNDVSAKQGRYLDLKLHPERAAELREAKEWPALGAFIEAVNRCDGFRTSGCMASGVTPGGHEAPYVDIVLDHRWTRVSTTALQKLVVRLQELNDLTIVPGFVLELCNSSARLPDGEEILSLRLWLIGTQTDADQAFPLIIAKLKEQEIADYISVAEQDYLLAIERRTQKAIEDRKSRIRLFIFLGLWIAFVTLGGWAASRYGWLSAIGGAIAGLFVYPFAVLGFFVVRWRLLSWWRKK